MKAAGSKNVKKESREKVSREVKITPSRFRNAIGKYRVIRSAKCIGCGKCAELCPHGVHLRYPAYDRTMRPRDYKCRGFECTREKYFCIDKCPAGALSLKINPAYEALGDMRWTNELILSTWDQAENGRITNQYLESNVGQSGGGFDRIRIKFPKRLSKVVRPEEVNTTVLLNRRLGDNSPKIKIGVPWYGGGMSFGSVSDMTMIGKARAAEAWDSFTSTGEGGYPEYLQPYDNNVITQVATGLFGVREDTVARVRIVEFKYAQGAKPGLGGHLLADKNTQSVARMREAVPGTALFSPFPFHSVYSIEDHKKHVDWIKAMNPGALVSAKVSTPSDVDMVAVGCYYAGVHIVHIDGSYGGTGAAPDIAKKNIAMPIEYAIPKVHDFLVQEGVRDEVTLIASGGVRSAHDLVKAIALGADACVIGTAELVSLECIRCGNCESGRGCARGIATTDPELSRDYDEIYASQRIINLYNSWLGQIKDILAGLGVPSVTKLRGRSDLLYHLDYPFSYESD
jgi:glutamate synthase domain-containing protein 2/formate hydrogenlyase subunit 6/NADH:ubiquinone oxidoreductase subunit I